MDSNPSSSRTTRYLIWGIALVLVVLAVVAIRSLTRERLPVHVDQVAYRDLIKPSSTNGKVEPVDDFQAHAQVAGQVQDIYVDVGQKVKAGQLLLKMDDKYALANLAHANSTLQAAELAASDVQHGGSQDERNTYAGDLSRAQLQLQQDAASLAELQKLEKQGASSAAEVAAAQQRVAMDESNIHSIQQHSTQRYGDADRARAQSQLTDAKAAVAAAESSYASADIRTPISGTVYYLPVSRYDYVSTEEPDLVYVADLTKLRITAYFDEPEIGNLAVGQPVVIKWEAHPEKVWHGHVLQTPTTIITFGTRNVGECFITVDDADGVLQPNANVTITVTTAEHKHVLSIPRSALHTDSTGAYVFRVVDGKLVRTAVQKDIVNDNWAEITSGLSEGDTVVTTNGDLSDGLEVTPVQP